MSVIANFGKRREAKKAKQVNVKQAAKQVAVQIAEGKEATALELLAQLLACEPQDAIIKAKVLIGQGAYIAGLTAAQLEAVEQQLAEDKETFIGVDLASGEDKTVIAPVTEAAEQVESAAETISESATEISDSATDISDASSGLAYSVDDIASATSDLKEATEELKKPSEAQKSSPSEKAAKPKKSSKK